MLCLHLQERLEGGFRYLHATSRSNIEAISMYGGTAVERRRADAAFLSAVDNRRRIIRRHLPLYLSTFFLDYAGSVVNYAGG